MRTFTLFTVLLAPAIAGCGALNVSFVERDAREGLVRSMHLTLEFKYESSRTGLLGGIFGSDSIENPRLLYSIEARDYSADPSKFMDTGAEFDQARKTAAWNVASPKKLYGMTGTFVITGDNIGQPACTRVAFPAPGRITDAPMSWDGNKLVFTLETEGQVFSPEFFLKLWNRPEKRISVKERGGNSWEWSYPGEISPSDTRTPISFKITGQDWYRKPLDDAFQTVHIYIAPGVTFESLKHDESKPGHVRISFKAWGKTGLLRFEHSKDGKTFEAARGISDPVKTGESFAATWDLKADGLDAYTGIVRLRATTDGRFIGDAELLPPGPAVEIAEAVQEEDAVRLKLKLANVPSESISVFAGSKQSQRELRPDEFVERTADEIVFRHAGLPRDSGGRLYVFISARNAAGLKSAESVLDLVSLKVRSVKQAGPRIEIEYSVLPADSPVELSFLDAASGKWRKAGAAEAGGGRISWEFSRDVGSGLQGPLKLKLRAARGTGGFSDFAEASALSASLDKPVQGGSGAYAIPCRIFGSPDWLEFSWSHGESFSPARNARLVPARDEIQWDLWADVRKSSYDGRPVILRLTLKNRYGSASFDSLPIKPLYVRISGSSQTGQLVTVSYESSEEVVKTAFFFAFANRGEFAPLTPLRIDGKTFTFDLTALGRDYSNFVRVRIIGLDSAGGSASDEASIRLVAGFEPSAASWQGKYLWVSYTVGWKVSEEDVKFSAAEAGKPDKSIPATTPMKRVFDVNNRACAWDVFSDMVALDVFSLDQISFRIDLRDPDKGSFYSMISFDRLPKPPLRIEETAVSVKNGCMAFSFRKMARDSSLPAFSTNEYRIDAEFICPVSGKFRAAARAQVEPGPGEFVWDRNQSMDAVKKGTWVLVIVSRRNNPQTVGFAIFRVKLEPDHAFYSDDY